MNSTLQASMGPRDDPAAGDQAWARAELTRFVKHARGRLRPEDVGLPSRGVRRVVGLRREEVAELAGVSLTWYTQFELGKTDAVSLRFLHATARALRLNDVEQRYLFALCDAPASPLGRSSERHGFVDLVAENDDVALAVLNGGLQFVAGNSLCRRLYLFEDTVPDTPSADLPLRIFEDLRSRRFFEDWDEIASLICGSLRMQVAHRDPRATRTVAALLANPIFRTHWERGRIADPRQIDHLARIRHPVLGACAVRLHGVSILDREHILAVSMPADVQTREAFTSLAQRG